MDPKIVVYFFSETSQTAFSEARKPFVKSDVAAKYAEKNLQTFKSCGGLKVTDKFENEKKHIRKSFWKTREGYHLWQQQMAATGYIQERREYHQLHGITAEVSGPSEVTNYEE